MMAPGAMPRLAPASPGPRSPPPMPARRTPATKPPPRPGGGTGTDGTRPAAKGRRSHAAGQIGRIGETVLVHDLLALAAGKQGLDLSIEGLDQRFGAFLAENVEGARQLVAPEIFRRHVLDDLELVARILLHRIVEGETPPDRGIDPAGLEIEQHRIGGLVLLFVPDPELPLQLPPPH